MSDQLIKMSDEISITLTLFANYTNFYSILSVLLCFFVMVIFILRLNGENFLSSSATHYPVVQEQSMVSLLNPFCVQLDTSKCTSLKDGLHVSLSMKKSSKVKLLWGVDICTFQKELQLSSSQISDRFSDNKFFEENFQHCVDCGIMKEEDGVRDLHFKSPGELSEQLLGEPPRMLYPVVVVCLLEDCDRQLDFTATCIVVQFTVIHLKDSICSLDSHIVYQFVKTNTNKLLGLQPIFVSSSESDSQKENENLSATGKNTYVKDSTSKGQQISDTKGEGQTLYMESDVPHHCHLCGKIGKHVENIPSTRQHEVCTCSESDLEDHATARSDVKVTGQETVNEYTGEESGIDNDGQGNDCINTSNINTNCFEDLETETDQLESCCVCQSSEIFYALLPCRHACVCSTCIKQLDKCPICRSSIEAYFRLHDRLSGQESRDDLAQAASTAAGPRLNRWQTFNQRLNEMLGFV